MSKDDTSTPFDNDGLDRAIERARKVQMDAAEAKEVIRRNRELARKILDAIIVLGVEAVVAYADHRMDRLEDD